ncbi:hypothetical protein PTTG_09644, partial [Puccinia triticina 1-1 BBBD Race 1]
MVDTTHLLTLTFQAAGGIMNMFEVAGLPRSAFATPPQSNDKGLLGIISNTSRPNLSIFQKAAEDPAKDRARAGGHRTLAHRALADFPAADLPPQPDPCPGGFAQGTRHVPIQFKLLINTVLFFSCEGVCSGLSTTQEEFKQLSSPSLSSSDQNIILKVSTDPPDKVVKTQMDSNRSQSMVNVLKAVWSRGGPLGFYQGLIPWAWIEALTKGAILLFTAAEIETVAVSNGISPAVAGLVGGISQAYATMGLCTCMKTTEITCPKQASA